MKYKIIILFLLVLAAFLANFGLNKNPVLKHKINIIFPYKFYGWDGTDSKADNAVYKVLDPNELLLRSYRQGDRQISLSIVLTNKRDHIHDPQICYRGQGIDMKEQKPVMYKDIKAIFVNGKKRQRDYKVIYWYTTIDKTYSSRSQFMKEVITSIIMGRPIPEYALVIVSGIDIDEQELSEFAEKVNDELNHITKQ